MVGVLLDPLREGWVPRNGELIAVEVTAGAAVRHRIRCVVSVAREEDDVEEPLVPTVLLAEINRAAQLHIAGVDAGVAVDNYRPARGRRSGPNRLYLCDAPPSGDQRARFGGARQVVHLSIGDIFNNGDAGEDLSVAEAAKRVRTAEQLSAHRERHAEAVAQLAPGATDCSV